MPFFLLNFQRPSQAVSSKEGWMLTNLPLLISQFRGDYPKKKIPKEKIQYQVKDAYNNFYKKRSFLTQPYHHLLKKEHIDL